MGKATRWFRSLLPYSKKKPNSNSVTQTKSSDNNERKKSDGPTTATWSSTSDESLDANKHAIAVAAATAAVAEAALAAAQAAAEVVRLTSAGGTRTRTVSSSYAGGGGGGSSRDRRRELVAAIKIQSAFRAYLARRALRALKGLVKLQALVRGRIVRKQGADMLRRMQAMARIQARACAGRVPSSVSPHSQMKASKISRAGSTKIKGYNVRQGSYDTKHVEPNLKRGGSKSKINDNMDTEKLHFGPSWLDRWMEESTRNSHTDTFRNAHLDDAKSDKILEIDTWKPRYSHGQNDKTFQASQHFSAWKDNGQGSTVFDPISGLSAKCQKPNPSISSEEVASLRSLNVPPQEDQFLAWAAEYSPHIHSATSRPGSSSRRAPFTPTRSECSRSLFGDYLAHPNYMANTESYLAKVRSQSAPKQRMQTERFTGRNHILGLWDVETISEKGSTPRANFRANARLETPVHGGTIGYRMAYEARP